jgi:hypothetical protein
VFDFGDCGGMRAASAAILTECLSSVFPAKQINAYSCLDASVILIVIL